MTTHPTIVHEVAGPRWEVVPAEAADDGQGTGGHGANDLLLVLGVAAVVIGVVMVSRGILPSQSAAHSVPPTHAALGRVERQVPAQEERVVATMPPTDRVPTTSAPRTASSGAPRVITACPPRLDLDHDLRLVLAAMALQRRRTLHPTAHVVPPDKQDVPAKDRALAGAMAKLKTQGSDESDARAEAPPQAIWRPNGPGC